MTEFLLALAELCKQHQVECCLTSNDGKGRATAEFECRIDLDKAAE